MKTKAQTAIEYLLLLAVVTVVVLVGFRSLLPRVHGVSGNYFDKVSQGIMGDPPPCMGTVLEDVTVIGSNASQYFNILSRGPFDSSEKCEDNGSNVWCDTPAHMIGCYEIADDIGGSDCNYSYTNIIHYRWLGAQIKRNQIDYIAVRTDTNKNVCGISAGNDDGWEWGIFTWVFSETNGWSRQDCEFGGGGGMYRLTVVFDGANNFSHIEVRAGDHRDSGVFEIESVEVNAKPLAICP